MEQQIRFCTAADGVRIAYATVGSGPPMMKAANWLNHLEFDWQSPIWRPLLEELAREFTLIRYDERGNGLSDWKVNEFTFESFVRDLEATVNAAGIDRFPLLGISQGAAVAIAYAVRNPERVTHLILQGGFAKGWAQRASPEEIERLETMLRMIRPGWGRDNPAFRQLWTTLYIPGGTPEQMNWFNELQRVTAPPENAIRIFEAVSEINVADLLPQVRIPTLVLHSQGDAVVPFEAGRAMAARIPGARFVTLESKNHLLLPGEAAWSVYLDEVRRFLRPAVALASGGPRPAPADSRTVYPGTILGQYHIEKKLGAGGMGIVYQARDTRLERPVALKLLAKDVPQNSEASHLLLQEARAASALNHPNVATVYEVGEADGRGYIAMEMVEGRPLSESIPPDGLPIESLIRYGLHIASALAHAHDRGIVHRDLKSANVVVTPQGEAKVLDFGLARRLTREELDEATRTLETREMKGTVAGTLHYMAPEVLRGGAADERSDLWALGVMLYEMAAGHLPFHGRTGFELTSAILREPPAHLPESVPAGVRVMIQRCLAKEPGQRYQRAGEVHAALEAIGSGRTITTAAAATAPESSASGAVSERRGRRFYIGLALLAVMILAGALLARLAWERYAPSSSAALLTTGGKPSTNAEANDDFERAWMLLESQNNLPRARALMQRALKIDPHFAEARAWYGFLWLLEIDGGFSNDTNLLYEAEKELRQALADDPQNGRALSALAALYLLQGRKELLPAQIDLASKADPDFLDTSTWLVLYHRINGDSERAAVLAREILARRPIFWPSRFQLGCALHDQGENETALVELGKVLEQDPRNRYTVEAVARIHLEAGDPANARALLQRLSGQNPKSYRTQLMEALAAAVEGRREEALLLMDEPLLKYGQMYVWAPADIAAVYAVLGDEASALEWLDRAVRFGDERLEWFQIDPLLSRIRDHPRFRQIIDSIALRRQQRTR